MRKAKWKRVTTPGMPKKSQAARFREIIFIIDSIVFPPVVKTSTGPLIEHKINSKALRRIYLLARGDRCVC